MSATSNVELAAFFVSWVAVAFLALMAASLHVRVAHLERALAGSARATPFSRVRGRSLRDSLPPPTPRLVLVLGSSCTPCRSLVADLAADPWQVPTVLAWKSTVPTDLPLLPPSIRSIECGSAMARELGVQAEPLALVLDDEGRIVEARATSSLSTLRALLDASAGNHHSFLTEVHA